MGDAFTDSEAIGPESTQTIYRYNNISTVTLWCTAQRRRVYLPAFFLPFVCQKAVSPGQEGQDARERSRVSSQGGCPAAGSACDGPSVAVFACIGAPLLLERQVACQDKKGEYDGGEPETRNRC